MGKCNDLLLKKVDGRKHPRQRFMIWLRHKGKIQVLGKHGGVEFPEIMDLINTSQGMRAM